MESTAEWTENSQKNGNGRKGNILSFLVLLGFTISGVLEHAVLSTGNPPPLSSSNFSRKIINGSGRYCDPPNMTVFYYDSSEEIVGEEHGRASVVQQNFRINLTTSEKAELLRGKRLSWGILFSYFPATIVVCKIGPKKVFGYALLLLLTSSLYCTLTRPKISEEAPYVFGFFIGALVPPFFQLSVNWFPSNRRSSFLSLLSGKYLGYAICDLVLSTTDLIYENHVFYIYLGMAVITFTWYVVWSTMVLNSPNKEIKNSENRVKKNKLTSFRSDLPLRRILGSRPIWMSIGVIFGAFSGEVAIRKSMRSYLKYVTYASGDLQAISFFLHFLFAISSGYLVDFLLKIRFVSTTSSRRMVVYVSHFIPAGFLFVIGFAGCQELAPLLFYCFAGMTTGANYSGAYTSPVDLSPKYAVIIVAFCFTIGQTGSLFMDYLTLCVLAGQVYGSWRFLFSLASLILLVSAIFFMLRGSGSVQPWNNPEVAVIDGKSSKINKFLQPPAEAPMPKPRAKSIYTVEQKILKVLHVQEPDKFTRVRAYSTSSPNGKSTVGAANVYRPSSKKRASIS